MLEFIGLAILIVGAIVIFTRDEKPKGDTVVCPKMVPCIRCIKWHRLSSQSEEGAPNGLCSNFDGMRTRSCMGCTEGKEKDNHALSTT